MATRGAVMGCCFCAVQATVPCAKFDSPHRFCHCCGFTKLLHKPAPVLTVIEGGKGDDADRWGAWLNGEVQ